MGEGLRCVGFVILGGDWTQSQSQLRRRYPSLLNVRQVGVEVKGLSAMLMGVLVRGQEHRRAEFGPEHIGSSLEIVASRVTAR